MAYKAPESHRWVNSKNMLKKLPAFTLGWTEGGQNVI
jgi:hypothetical protein